ncbi:uncharacterized protein RAG0_14829 [Rhynchosporium agropyri]|uniref:Uncharacterized protein n=1 Tax=Rhynchosporium agropyri TaxID=914238 RepID=A0A1E1LIF2_9HELO|nr:uncharacterized protein RAG0_14829 [Rhynchosporium agropyri]
MPEIYVMTGWIWSHNIILLLSFVKIEGGNRPKNSIEEDTYTVESYYYNSIENLHGNSNRVCRVQAGDKVQGVGARVCMPMQAKLTKIKSFEKT